MVEPDTIKLLRECDAGIRMGIDSISEVYEYVHDELLKNCLLEARQAHERLKEKVLRLLGQYHDDGKDPNPIAKGMSWIKTNVSLVLNESDQTIAELMTDGCNMGVKSLNQYLNQYKAADEETKSIAKKLIHIEEDMTRELACYL